MSGFNARNPSSSKPGCTEPESATGQDKTKTGKRWDDDDGWGGFKNYMDAKRQKLSDQFDIDRKGLHSNIFSGVAIYVNGYTTPSSDELRRLMQQHGGRYELYLSRKRVTHVIASNLPNSKFKLASTMLIVKPDWIIESVKAGRRLSHVPYLLLGNQSKLQPGLKSLAPGKLAAATTVHEDHMLVGNIPEDKFSPGQQKSCPPGRSPDTSMKLQNVHDDGGISKTGNPFLRGTKQKCDKMPKNNFEHKNVKSCMSSDLLTTPNPTDELDVDDSESDTDIVYNSDEDDSTKYVFGRTPAGSTLNDSRKSRIYTMCKFKKSLNGTLDSPKIVNSNSCDGFIGVSSKTMDSNSCDGFIGVSSKTMDSNSCDGFIESSDSSHPHQGICKKGSTLVTLHNSLNGNTKQTETAVSSNSKKPPFPLEISRKSPPAEPIAKAMNSPHKKPMAKAGENNFLNEFYSNSRLHHISKWGAELKAYVAEIQKRGNCTFQGREKLRQSHVDRAVQMGLAETLTSGRHGACEKTIMHIDMDSFFVSVGLLTRPELRDLPVAVTHSKGQASKVNPRSDLAWEKSQWQKKWQGKLKGESTADQKREELFDDDAFLDGFNVEQKGYDFQASQGQMFNSMAEIASCSYQAREAGLKNGMFMGQALKLCPDLKTIPYEFDEYNRVSRVLYDLVASYTHDIEAVSCDEMFIDATDILTDTGATAMELASVLRADLIEQTSCPASVGVGPNILLARLATRKAKPNGQHQVQSIEARDFIRDQSVRDLPGVGYSMSHKLAKMSVHICGQLQAVPLVVLQREFGPKTGESLHQFSLGLDNREIRGNKQRKSVSAEINYGIRFSKESEALRFLQELSLEVKRRLDAIKVKGGSITLKLMVRRPDAPVETAKFMGHGICNTLNKSSNLPVATNDGNLIGREVISLYRAQKVAASDVRGVGIQISKLEGQGSAQVQKHGHQSILAFATVSSKEIVTPTRGPKLGQSGAGIMATLGDTSVSLTTAKNSATFTNIRHAPPGANHMSPSKDCASPSKDHSSHSKDQASHSRDDASYSKGHTAYSKDHISHSKDLGQGTSRKHVSDFERPGPGSRKDITPAGDFYKPGPSTRRDTSPVVYLDKPGPSSERDTPPLVYLDKPGPSSDRDTPPLVYLDKPGPSSERDSPPEAVNANILSESQIDIDVLQELPSDIAEEVLQDLRIRKKQLTEEQQDPPPHTNKRKADPNPHSTNSSERMDFHDILPSLSQVDPSCFSALPLELQRELEKEYACQEEALRSPHKKRARPTEERQPLPGVSPTKGKKLVAGLKGKQPARRGRPPGKTKIHYRGSRVKAGVSEKNDLDVAEDIIIYDSEPPVTDIVSDDPTTEGGQTGSVRKGHPASGDDERLNESNHFEEVSLCSAHQLDDVRRLLKEWLSAAGSEPQPEDVQLVIDYFIRLVESENLEQAYCLLKFFKRKEANLKNSKWLDCLRNLTSCVQNTVIANYGTPFKL